MQKGLKIFLAILMTVLLALVSIGCGSQSVSNLNGISVKAVAADKHEMQATLDIAGVLVPVQTANIASKTGGQVKTISTDVGNSVNSGDTVITLETKEVDAQLQQAQAALNSVGDQAAQAKINLDAAQKACDSTKQLLGDQAAQAKINLDAAQTALDRTKKLVDSGAVNQSQLDDIQSKYDLAKKQYDMAQVDTGSAAQSQIIGAQSKYDLAKKQYEIATSSAKDQAVAAVNTVKVQLDNADIKSPISGIIVNKNINVGEIASPGVALLTVVDTSTLKLKGTVPQEAVPQLQPGQQIKVTIDVYPNREFDGQIDQVGPMAVSTGEYFPIEISIKNPGDIKAGLSAHASINMTANEGVVVPASAVVQNDGQSYVFVIKNNVVSKRIVTVGLKNDKEIQITKGLDAGEKVASTSVNNLIDGMPVNVN